MLFNSQVESVPACHGPVFVLGVWPGQVPNHSSNVVGAAHRATVVIVQRHVRGQIGQCIVSFVWAICTTCTVMRCLNRSRFVVLMGWTPCMMTINMIIWQDMCISLTIIWTSRLKLNCCFVQSNRVIRLCCMMLMRQHRLHKRIQHLEVLLCLNRRCHCQQQMWQCLFLELGHSQNHSHRRGKMCQATSLLCHDLNGVVNLRCTWIPLPAPTPDEAEYQRLWLNALHMVDVAQRIPDTACNAIDHHDMLQCRRHIIWWSVIFSRDLMSGDELC